MENGPFIVDLPIKKWWCSIAMLVHQRVLVVLDQICFSKSIVDPYPYADVSIAIGQCFESMHCQHGKWASSIDLYMICMNIFISLCHVWSPRVIINHQPSRISLSSAKARITNKNIDYDLDLELMFRFKHHGKYRPFCCHQSELCGWFSYRDYGRRCWWVSDSCQQRLLIHSLVDEISMKRWLNSQIFIPYFDVLRISMKFTDPSWDSVTHKNHAPTNIETAK